MDLDRRAARRGSTTLSVTLATFLAVGCSSSESAPTVPTVVTTQQKSESSAKTALTTEGRKAIINRVWGLQIALAATLGNGIVPKLDYVVQMSDPDLQEFWNSRVVRQETGFTEWKLSIRKDNEPGTPISPTRVFVMYNPEYPDSPVGVIMRSNFIEASHIYPSLQQFVNRETNQIPVEQLQAAMEAYLNIPFPKETKYYPLYESQDSNSKQIGLFAKFGNSTFGVQTIHAVMHINGETSMSITNGDVRVLGTTISPPSP